MTRFSMQRIRRQTMTELKRCPFCGGKMDLED
nr:MAG TPA: restriction alleviation protein [Bacteriophage sp.]